MDAASRFKIYLKSEKISKSEFYRLTGISNGYLDKVKSIGADKIEIILEKFPELNLYWLIKGEGEPKLSNLKASTDSKYYKTHKTSEKHLLQEGDKPYVPLRENTEIKRLTQMVELLEGRIIDLKKHNDLLHQFLNEKDERIKLLMEKIKD